ncbi:MAG: hypothetical protein M0C28_08730 [Candidatus Moduliflexus flocculans]|nr:hypothetical protein [Candidatus Moduliflexus flocculans]
MIGKIFKKTSCLAKYWTKFLLLSAILLLSSCYYYPHEQVMTQPAQDENITAITQIYFYPNQGQSTEQQSRDHYACYNWAVDQTGFDPERVIHCSRTTRPCCSHAAAWSGYHHHVHCRSGAGRINRRAAACRRRSFNRSSRAALCWEQSSDISRQESARQMEEAYNNRNQATGFSQGKKGPGVPPGHVGLS